MLVYYISFVGNLVLNPPVQNFKNCLFW